MSDGRTIWRARDTHWREREWIVILGEEFGAAGPAVIDYLEDQAKIQNDGGRVKSGPRAVARGAFVDSVTVGHVLSRAVTLGLLVDYRESNGRFVCTIAWFAADQGKGLAANRKQRQRSGATVKPDDPAPLSRSVTQSHAPSRGVTNTVQNSTDTSATQKNITAELRSAVVEVFAYWQEKCDHRQAHPSDDRLSKIRTRLKERQRHHDGNLRRAVLDLRQAIDGAAAQPFVGPNGKRHDDIELICRSNAKLEDFMDRSSLPADHFARATVHPLRRENASDMLRSMWGGEQEEPVVVDAEVVEESA